MIDERMEEQASLHVLGALSETEAREFKKAMQADPELQKFVAGLTRATGAIAGSVHMVEPPSSLRAKILAQAEPAPKNISAPRNNIFQLWLPWSLAACLALLGVLLFGQNRLLQRKVGLQAHQITTLNQLAQLLQATTNDLQNTVLALQKSNQLADMRIAMLNSLLADSPKAVAVSLWDETKQEGVFVVQNLKPLPADKDYQLWVIDPQYKTPVDAGVFQVDKHGNVRLDFKTKSEIGVAEKFAVTMEAKGGVAVPTMQNMVLIGG